MKYLVSFAASVLVATIILSVMPVYGETEIYNDVLRLHVIAESDSEEDQALKLKVRDAVLECVSASISECETYEDAYEVIDSMRDEIIIAAEKCVEENGENCTVSLALGREKYPRRDYDGTVLPAGVYNSLRITLGEGEGKNWWCVLFPTFCMGFARKSEQSEEYVATGFTPQEYRMITGESGEVRVRFKILEMLSEVLGFKY
ncbi:MAG: stage II sporulation protein R [Clostridia bacterium]|nr:stage II sporulation protein R [Clostridia bacterium]